MGVPHLCWTASTSKMGLLGLADHECLCECGWTHCAQHPAQGVHPLGKGSTSRYRHGRDFPNTQLQEWCMKGDNGQIPTSGCPPEGLHPEGVQAQHITACTNHAHTEHSTACCATSTVPSPSAFFGIGGAICRFGPIWSPPTL